MLETPSISPSTPEAPKPKFYTPLLDKIKTLLQPAFSSIRQERAEKMAEALVKYGGLKEAQQAQPGLFSQGKITGQNKK